MFDPWVGKIPWKREWQPTQVFLPRNPMDRGAWQAPIHEVVKNLPAAQETQVQSLGWEDPLEKEMETHSSVFAWKIPWAEEPGGLQPMGSRKSRT